MPRGRKKTSKTFKKRRKQFKKKFKRKTVAGNTLVRTFKYPLPEKNTLVVAGVSTTSVPDVTRSATYITHSLDNAGAKHASVFLKYYQFYQLKRVFLTFKRLTPDTAIVFTASSATPVGPGTTGGSQAEGHIEIVIAPWRDGIKYTTPGTAPTADVITKVKQVKGAKVFRVSNESLLKGYTVSYKPNVLNVGWETKGSTTGLTYYNYSPVYNQWITNNDSATDHYGYSMFITQTGRQTAAFSISQSITVAFKDKIVDPMVSLEAESASNITSQYTFHNTHLNGHALNHDEADPNQVRAVSRSKQHDMEDDETDQIGIADDTEM